MSSTTVAHGARIPSRSSGTGLDFRDVSIRIPLPGRPRRWVYPAHRLNLRLAAGEVTAIVGESGCGKSVLALAALGLLPPGTQTSGSIRLGDTEVLGASEDALRAVRGQRIGLVPQSAATHLTPVRTVVATLAETLRVHGRPAGRAVITDLLADFGLAADTAERYPHELSGGMAQRVLVAMTVALGPEVIVADEPTSALDPDTTSTVLDALAAQKRSGAAVLLITHDLVAASRVADRVAVMYAGRFLEIGPAGIVLASPAHDYSQALLAALPHNGFRPPPGLPSSLVEPDQHVCAWHARAGVPCPATPLQEMGGGHQLACLDAG